jgi:hypothetical protein
MLMADVSEHSIGSIFIGLHLPTKMEPIECSETSASNIQTPGIYPKESELHLQHGENLNLNSQLMFTSIKIVKVYDN